MLWRFYRWSLLHPTPNRLFITSVLPLRFLSSATVCVTNPTTQSKKFRENQHFPDKNNPFITLTHQIVHSTLLSCTSDLIALSFFLWCAKQPNYFHPILIFTSSLLLPLMRPVLTLFGSKLCLMNLMLCIRTHLGNDIHFFLFFSFSVSVNFFLAILTIYIYKKKEKEKKKRMRFQLFQ